MCERVVFILIWCFLNLRLGTEEIHLAAGKDGLLTVVVVVVAGGGTNRGRQLSLWGRTWRSREPGK